MDTSIQSPDSSPDLLAYHALTHTLISSFHKRLAGITSKRVADQFLVSTAAQVVKNLVGDSPHPLEEIRNIIEKYGYHLQEVREGDYSSWSTQCPYAQTVHPKLPSDNMICPVSLLVAGAIRLQEPNSAITQNSLLPNGSKFTIQHKPEKNPLAMASVFSGR